ncbi:MAG: helicase C-terminal domain-containing protein, partial [Oscillospiraceae bacterium]|nr:helicase C-terminal domain-containing protein [Oscillospiraceae bacterium]
GDAELVDGTGGGAVPRAITHLAVEVPLHKKIEALRKYLNMNPSERVMVFINKSDQITNVAEKLKYHKVSAEGVHGSSFHAERRRVLNAFRHGEVAVLVTSDLMSRGLDIGLITRVVNLDLPADKAAYLNRSGRTGRMGAVGEVITLSTPAELRPLLSMANALGIGVGMVRFREGSMVPAGELGAKAGPGAHGHGRPAGRRGGGAEAGRDKAADRRVRPAYKQGKAVDGQGKAADAGGLLEAASEAVDRVGGGGGNYRLTHGPVRKKAARTADKGRRRVAGGSAQSARDGPVGAGDAGGRGGSHGRGDSRGQGAKRYRADAGGPGGRRGTAPHMAAGSQAGRGGPTKPKPGRKA